MTTFEALNKAKKYCVYQERCEEEVRKKLTSFLLSPAEIDEIIEQLVFEKFIDNRRYAEMFVRGKSRIKKWGKHRIILELRRKKISDEIIKNSLGEIGKEEYFDTLTHILTKKKKELTGKDVLIQRNKLILFAKSKGYEMNLIFEVIENLLP